MMLTSCRTIQRFTSHDDYPEASSDEMVTTIPSGSDSAILSTTTTTTTTAATTTATVPTALPTDSSYKTVNYTLPVANPNKEIYSTPNGNKIGTFGSVGYYSVIQEAKDSQGRTWGQLSSGGGWTLVYFDVLPELELWFGSGAGAWGTALTINGKGEFSGNYHDSEAGSTGDTYPNGSCYICDFEGTFAITDIDGYTVSLKLTNLTNLHANKKEYVKEGIRYIPSAPYGLDGATEYTLYLPNTPVNALPEAVYQWSPPDGLQSSATLGCYALYCPETGYTFFE